MRHPERCLECGNSYGHFKGCSQAIPDDQYEKHVCFCGPCSAKVTELQAELARTNNYLSDPLALAVLFHVTYEKLAPQNAYETRTETRIFDPESANGKLMIATCTEIQKAIREDQGS